MEEKRRYRRSDLEDRVTLKYIGTPREGDSREIEVSIMDVSEDGVGFFYEKELDIEECFMGEMTLWTKQRMNVFLKVIRRKQVEDGFEYGCIFFGMESKEALRIKIYQLLEDNDEH